MQAKVIAFPLAQQYHEVYHVRDAQSFIHDPGMIKMPDGRLLAFSPCWKKGPEPEYKVVVSESIDNGLCWKEICILPYSDATPFLYNGVLYLFTEYRQHEGVYFTCSFDGGYTWEDPIQVSDKGYWNCQTSMVQRDGKLYWCMDDSHLRLVAACCDLEKGVMNPDAWRFSEPLTLPETPRCLNRHLNPIQYKKWPGAWPNEFGVLEANVVDVHGELVVIARVIIDEYSTVNLGAYLKITDTDEDGLGLLFLQYHPLPGGQCKFSIAYDKLSDMFYMASNLPANSIDLMGYREKWIGSGCSGSTGNDRRILALWYSLDTFNWIPIGIIAIAQKARQAFMYPSMLIDGDDLILLSRTSIDAPNQHDADYSTFHRISNFRELTFDIRPVFD